MPSTYLIAALCLVALVHANDTHETDVSSVVGGVPATSQDGVRYGRRASAVGDRGVALGTSSEGEVVLLEVSEGGDPAQQEETKDEATKPKKKDPPQPYEHPEPPYDLWMSQASSFPPGKLLPPDQGPTQLPKVTHVDVKKYREGREGDEIGLKIGLKELRQKSKIEKTTAQRNMFESEKGLKAKMMAGAKNTQKDFKKSERRSKEEAKEAAKDPEKSGSGADEQAHKARTDKKRAEKAKEDELKDYNDPNSVLEGDDGGSMVELGDSDDPVDAKNTTKTAVPNEESCDKAGVGIVSICRLAGDDSTACQGAKTAFSKHCTPGGKQSVSVSEDCEKANLGVNSICKLTGGDHSACKSARNAFAKHCDSSVLESASLEVKKIKKKAAMQLAGKLKRVNERTERELKILNAQMESVTSEDAKKKIREQIETIQAEAAKKIVAKARRVQRRAARKMTEKVGTAVAAAKPDKPKVGTTKRLEGALESEAKKAKAKVEQLELEYRSATSEKTKRELKRKIQKEEEGSKKKLEEDAEHVARKQIKKRTRAAKKKSETEVALLETMKKVATSSERKQELDRKIVEMKHLLKDKIEQTSQRIKDKSKRETEKAVRKATGKNPADVQTQKEEVAAAVEKMVANAAKDEDVAKRVKTRIAEKVRQTREEERKKADEKIKRVKAEAFDTISEVKQKAGHTKGRKKDNATDEDAKEDEEDASKASSNSTDAKEDDASKASSNSTDAKEDEEDVSKASSNSTDAKEDDASKASSNSTDAKEDDVSKASSNSTDAKEDDVSKASSNSTDAKEASVATLQPLKDATDIDSGNATDTSANVTRSGTSLFVKKGSLIHKDAREMKAAVKKADQTVKDLEAKKEAATDETERASLSKKIKDAKAKTASMQSDYYHKTGPVPAHLQKEAEADLKKVGLEAAKSIGTPAGHGDPENGVPHESMDAYKNVIVPAAVAAAAPKVAELRHKKNTSNALKKDQKAGGSRESRTNQKVVHAQVDAAEKMAKDVKKRVTSGKGASEY